MVKHGREKAAKKIQGTAPVWFHEVLHAAGVRYFCPTCLPLSASISVVDTSPQSPDLLNKIAALDHKVDRLLSVFNDASQATDTSPSTSTHKASSTKLSLANIVASQSKEMVHNVVTEIFQK